MQPGGPVNPGGVHVPPGYQGIIAAQVSPIDLFGNPISCSSRIVEKHSGAILDHTSSEPDGKGGYYPMMPWVNYKNETREWKQLQLEITSSAHAPFNTGFHGFDDNIYLFPVGV